MKVCSLLVVAMLCIGFFSNVEVQAAALNIPNQTVFDETVDRVRHLVLGDAVTGVEEGYGYTNVPAYDPLEVHISDDPDYAYMAISPYYSVYFKDTKVKMVVKGAWVELELVGTDKDTVLNTSPTVEKNSLSVTDVFQSTDLSYKVEPSVLEGTLTLNRQTLLTRIIEEISWGGVEPAYEEDGSILFSLEDEEVVRILPPFMRDAQGDLCMGLHYEIVKTETGYELHKIIDESGLEWLEKAVYPVVVDPSMQTFEDAWQSSGLTPYGQYFKNVREYVNPAAGYLTMTQNDLSIPGRGVDVVISRVYETPAVFYGASPYDYEAPPVDVGKGWQLNFPYVGTKYLHLWEGTIYKIAWVGSTFENHKGTHFILVKNGDSTYTLAMADGVVYEFNTSG